MATFVQQAISSVSDFGQIYEKFSTKLHVHQYSLSSIGIYCSQLARISLFFGKLPDSLSGDDLSSYLSSLSLGTYGRCSPSTFKHAVHALRCYFRLMNLELPAHSLPPIHKSKSLFTVLSQEEVRRFLHGCSGLRSKFLFGLVYSCGLRLSEALHLAVYDLDRDRMMVHIRQGKGCKDRYVPLPTCLLPYLNGYIQQYHPLTHLFFGLSEDVPLSSTEFYTLFRLAVRESGIRKRIVPHTLRHSYATHLLEMGANLVLLKELLGHANIRSTMTYLHVCVTTPGAAFSPLDKLFPPKNSSSLPG